MTVVRPHRPSSAYAGITATFVGGLAVAGALAHLLDRDPREHHALDLVVLEAATFNATTQILAPRFGRVLTWTLAAAALNDWLQAGFAALTTKANALERRAE